MLKCSSERWICAPHNLSAGTSTSPRVFASFRTSIFKSLSALISSGSSFHFALAAKIDLCEIDDFAFAAIEDGFDHEEAETLDLIDGDGWRHGEFLAADDGFDQSWPVMQEGLFDCRPHLIG